jgi:hypothetical protein
MRLPAGTVLCFDDESGQRTVSRCQSGGQSRGSGSDNDDIPECQVCEIQIRFERLYIEIGHVVPRFLIEPFTQS